MRYPHRGIITGLLVAWAVLLVQPLPAVEADSRKYDDISVSVVEPPYGESGYGYVAYRVSIKNDSKSPHRVRVQIPATSFSHGGNDNIERMTRTVDLEAGAATTFEMLQPPVQIQGNGAGIYIDGVKQRRGVSVNTVPHLGYNPGQLVLVSRNVDSVIKDGIDTAIEDDNSSGSTSTSHWGYGGYGHRSVFTLVRGPGTLPEWGTSWLGYTRYMTVLLSENDLVTMPPALSDALRSYVLTGGTLAVVYDSAEAPVPNDWLQEWPHASEAEGSYDYGLGKVHLISQESAVSQDSKGWIKQLNYWHSLTGSRAVKRGTEDANRDMPVIEGQVTPARGLLLVMFIFAVVIGPVNVLVLWVLKRRMLLLVTVPLIALFFSAAVMAYALVSEGITPEARTASLTVLDQRSHRAVTVGVGGYYAPLTPANGLWFDENTMVSPQFEQYGYGYYGGSNTGRSRTLDVSNGQHLSSGWVAARIPAHFVLRKSERRHERLEVSTDSDGAVSVVNGLGSDITKLVLVDPDGTRWTAHNIVAGQSVSLTPSVQNPGYDAPESLAEIVRRDDWAAAGKVIKRPDRYLTPGSYVAQISDSAFLDPGLEGLKEHRTDCVVFGYYGEGG